MEYCHFWQRKLARNPDIEFPDRLCQAIAEITDKFSFAYIQEAFVATLLALARDESRDRRASDSLEDAWVEVGANQDQGDSDDLDSLKLWVEIKKQVAILRQGMDEGDGQGSVS